MGSGDYIRNIFIMSGGLTEPKKNAPPQYANRKRQYLGAESTAFIKQYAKYSSDFFAAQAQGLNPEDPTKWETVSMRMADMIKPSASMTRNIDDYKMILIGDESIDYIRPGTKFTTMGSTWLAINPENISGAYGSGVVERCNAVWHYLDWYGNVCDEPIAVATTLARASTPDPQDIMLIAKDYFNVKCQYNEATRQLDSNSRLILGSGAYSISGFSDFTQEFTSEKDSIRLLEFTIRYEQPNYEIDDMINRVAGGKTFSWDITVEGAPLIETGQSTTFKATSERCGESADAKAEHPVTYIWSTSDEQTAEIDPNTGVVTAKSAGECVITVTLAENTQITAEYTLTVTEAGTDDGYIAWLAAPTQSLAAFETAYIKAAYFKGGIQTQDAVMWDFEGADEDAYEVSREDDNTLRVTCWAGSVTPLKITALCNDKSIGTIIALEGI